MACKGSGVQIPSAPPHFTRSNGVKLGKQAGTEPQQNPNPAATPLPGRLNAKQATVDSERRYPCWRGRIFTSTRNTGTREADRLSSLSKACALIMTCCCAWKNLILDWVEKMSEILPRTQRLDEPR